MARFNRRLARVATLAAALCGALLASPAEAADAAPTTADDDALGTHQKHVRLDVGARTQFVADAGLDPFATNDVIGQLTAQASWVFWTRDALSLAAVGAFDIGGREAAARSDEAELDLRRFTLAPEVRYHVLRVLALTAKVGPTLTREEVELRGGLDSPFHQVGWKLGFDATAGAAVELFGFRSGASRKPRLWLTGEGGYGWTAPMELVLSPENAGATPQRLTPLTLPDLRVAGPLFRLTVALSFW
jgi:hypothetical protein